MECVKALQLRNLSSIECETLVKMLEDKEEQVVDVVAERHLYVAAFNRSVSYLVLELFDGIQSLDFEAIEKKWMWIEQNISLYYFNIEMLSSFALVLLDIHNPQEQRRSLMKGNLVDFINAETQQETLLNKLLVDFANYPELQKQLEQEMEHFFVDMLKPEFPEEAERAYITLFNDLRSDLNGIYNFWLQWFGSRSQHIQRFVNFFEA